MDYTFGDVWDIRFDYDGIVTFTDEANENVESTARISGSRDFDNAIMNSKAESEGLSLENFNDLCHRTISIMCFHQILRKLSIFNY